MIRKGRRAYRNRLLFEFHISLLKNKTFLLFVANVNATCDENGFIDQSYIYLLYILIFIYIYIAIHILYVVIFILNLTYT